MLGKILLAVVCPLYDPSDNESRPAWLLSAVRDCWSTHSDGGSQTRDFLPCSR